MPINNIQYIISTDFILLLNIQDFMYKQLAKLFVLNRIKN